MITRTKIYTEWKIYMEENKAPREYTRRKTRRRRPEEGSSMKRKFIVLILIIIALAAVHFGFRAEEKEPPNLALNYPAICTQMTEEFNDKTKHPEIMSAEFAVDTEQKQVHMMFVITEDTDKTVAPKLADQAIRRFGQLTHNENPALQEESDEYYGEVFDTFGCAVGIATPSQMAEDASKWYINANVLPTLHTRQAPKLPTPSILNF